MSLDSVSGFSASRTNKTNGYENTMRYTQQIRTSEVVATPVYQNVYLANYAKPINRYRIPPPLALSKVNKSRKTLISSKRTQHIFPTDTKVFSLSLARVRDHRG